MWMYLDVVLTFTIMLQGRWESGAFLTYIWKQVKEFSSNISHQMIQSDSFYNIMMDDKRDPEDPIIRRDPHNFSNNGRNTGAPFLAPCIYMWEYLT